MIEVPVMLQWLWLIFLLVALGDGLDLLWRAEFSPQVMGAGMPHPESYSGEITKLCGFGIIRGGGARLPIPHEGNNAIISPLVHIHRIGEHALVEAVVTPDRPLEEAPVEIKSDVRSKRKGVWGINTVSIGWLSRQELETHKKFKTKGDRSKEILTKTFIEEEAKQASRYDIPLQISDNETTGLSNALGVLTLIGKQHLSNKKKGFMNNFFKE